MLRTLWISCGRRWAICWKRYEAIGRVDTAFVSTTNSDSASGGPMTVPAPRINDIVRGRRGVSADTAMRLARYFGGDARSWLNLQAAYDLRVAEIASGKRIAREISPAAA
jgi:addiction module HigA family antidote